jgi:elongation factor 1-beta
MGKVMITFRLMPDGPETDLGKIEEAARGILGDSFKNAQSKPFAFGLDALFIVCVVPDEQGAADRLESSLSQIENVQGIEMVGVDLV